MDGPLARKRLKPGVKPSIFEAFNIKSVHEGIKDHKCETCGKEFGDSRNLQKHIKNVHEGQKDYTCYEKSHSGNENLIENLEIKEEFNIDDIDNSEKVPNESNLYSQSAMEILHSSMNLSTRIEKTDVNTGCVREEFALGFL